MKTKTKIGAGLITALIAIMVVFMAVQSFAADSMWIQNVGQRENNDVYKNANIGSGKTIWKYVSYENATATTKNYDDAIYCINPEVGFGTDDSQDVGRQEYNTSFNMKDLSEVEQKYTDMLQTMYGSTTWSSRYNSMLWIIDNMYLPKQTPEADRIAMKQILLDAAGINRDVLTDNDIEVVQQLALWYFSSENSKYHYEPDNFPTISWNDLVMETQIFNDDYNDGLDPDSRRYNDMKKLYTYLVNSAKSNGPKYGQTDVRNIKAPSLSFTKPADNSKTETATISGTEYFIAGPYKIKDANNSSLPYTINISVLDQSDNEIPVYKLFDASYNEIETIDRTYIEKNTDDAGKEFYIGIPTTNTLTTKIKLNVKVNYFSTNATVWTHSTSYNAYQPVVIPKKTPQEVEILAEVKVRRPEFDLALRKFITQINGEDVTTSREPVVDVTDLASEDSTTATYTHPKNALKVKTGDLVTYTIRVYNEGEVDGYATEITDYVPDGMEFVSDNETNIEYKWSLSDDETKVTTNYLQKDAVDATNEENLIVKFDKNNMTVPASKDVKLVFKVTELNTSDKILRNIAEVSDDSDSNGNSVTDRDSTPNNVDLDNYNPPEDNSTYQQDDDDYEPVILEAPKFDLALRKYILEVNGEEVATRVPQINKNILNTGASTTADYKHKKNAVVVKAGDIVKYRLETYNEGEVDGYVYSIKDYLPEHLEFVPTDDFVKSGETSDTAKYEYTFDETTRLLTIFLNNKALGGVYANSLWKLNAYDGTTLDSKYIDINCKVSDGFEPLKDTYLTNVATMTYSNDNKLLDPNLIEDRDSNGDVFTVPTQEQLVSEAENAYIGHSSNKEDLTDAEYHYKGQQDDDDFEKIVVLGLDEKKFDLSLRKFITGVNDTVVTTREPKVTNLDKLATGEETTATYTHPKDPVLVKTGDMVTYTIRVYNEGEVSGFAEEVTDNIPEGLKFVPNDSTNIEYRWKLSEDGTKITTDYLSKAQSEDNLIVAFNKETKTLLYKDVKVVFEVIEPNDSDRILVNIAEISDDADENGNEVEDRDSTPGDGVEPQDDIDKEYLRLEEEKEFDLSLRKFITKVNSTDVTTRYPNLSINADGKIVYTHPKDPVLVANNDIVIYTIRVYNEGTMPGYAKEVTDDIPQGLAYLPKHETNIEYEWTLSEDGKSVSTDFLSKEKSAERQEDNLLKAFDVDAGITDFNPDYRDLKIAFRVTETNLTSNRIIINTAEITDDSDKDGNEVEDIDSTPGNNEPNEDDIDKEYLKVKYFDLSLLKWVSKAIVTENGETQVTDTGHTGLENPEPVVKVDLDRKNLDDVTVKFEYTIKITNEGEIEGYAKEISDYIPDGLRFIKADNPDWDEKDGKIVTRKLENTLLQPGESATVTVILTWINGEDNVGQKVNVAEISEDYNEHNSKDIDSTPDNKKDGEDDIDDAPVILTIRTGIEPSYTFLVLGCLSILTTGMILIKKYVL